MRPKKERVYMAAVIADNSLISTAYGRGVESPGSYAGRHINQSRRARTGVVPRRNFNVAKLHGQLAHCLLTHTLHSCSENCRVFYHLPIHGESPCTYSVSGFSCSCKAGPYPPPQRCSPHSQLDPLSSLSRETSRRSRRFLPMVYLSPSQEYIAGTLFLTNCYRRPRPRRPQYRHPPRLPFK